MALGDWLESQLRKSCPIKQMLMQRLYFGSDFRIRCIEQPVAGGGPPRGENLLLVRLRPLAGYRSP